MTDLYTNNWDSETHLSLPSGWTVANGAGLLVINNTFGDVVSGTQAFGERQTGDAAIYSGISARADMGVQSDQVAHFNSGATLHSVGHILRAQASDAIADSYSVIVESTDTGATVVIKVRKHEPGSITTVLGTSSSILTLAESDVYHLYTTIVGDTIDCYLWADGDTQPGTASFSVTDSTYTGAGYAGAMVASGDGNNYNLIDDYVITDAAGSGATGTGASTVADFTSDASGQSGTGSTGTGDSAIADFASDAAGSPTDTGSGDSTVGDFTSAASGSASAAIITEPLKNNTGTVLANETGATVYVYDVSDGSLVVTKTSQTTDASGIMAIADALIVSGTEYRIVIVLASGAEGMDRITAT